MAGNKEGGRKAAATNKKRYGDGFYARIGAKGGRNGHTGGFASNRELARTAGAKGGRISSRREDKEPLEVRQKREARRQLGILVSEKEETEKAGVWKRLKNFIN